MVVVIVATYCRVVTFLHTGGGYYLPGVIRVHNDLAIIALNYLLPACIRSVKGLSMLCTVPKIVRHMTGGIWLGLGLGDIQLVHIEIPQIVPSKRSIWT